MPVGVLLSQKTAGFEKYESISSRDQVGEAAPTEDLLQRDGEAKVT